MLATLNGFVWFLMQSTFGSGPAFFIFVALFAIVVAALIWLFIRAEPIEYWKYALLLLLPVIWIGVGLWGSYFWLDTRDKPIVPNPDWVSYPVAGSLFVYLGVAAGLIVYLRHFRWFTALFALLNLYFLVVMSFLSAMAISGTWL